VKRPKVDRHKPMHVTLRVGREIPSLRTQLLLNRVRGALQAAREKAEKKDAEFQLVHFKVERRDLATPTDVRNVLSYILNNARKHVRHVGHFAYADATSSGESFDGWSEPVEVVRRIEDDRLEWPQVRAWTWLLRVGWRRRGLISPFAVPGAKPR
jgi:hypothetical protein